jgi:glucosylceramidase
MARDLAGSKLKLFSTPWGPPAWMKTNGLMHGNGMLKGVVGGPYYQTWANYFVR